MPSSRRCLLQLPLTGLLFFSLACVCGGASVDTEAHLLEVCEASGPVQAPGELVALAQPAREPELATLVELSAGRTLVDGWNEPRDANELERLLREAAETTRYLTGEDAEARLLLLATPSTPAESVSAVFQRAHAVGIGVVDLVYQSAEPVDLPPYPDPAYAEELRAISANHDPASRQTWLAREFEDLLWLCPPGSEVFAAVATVEPEVRCEMLSRGLTEALPMCVLTDADKVITAVQMATEPRTPHRLTFVRVHPDPDGGTVMEGVGTWAELGPELARHEGKAVWLGASEGR